MNVEQHGVKEVVQLERLNVRTERRRLSKYVSILYRETNSVSSVSNFSFQIFIIIIIIIIISLFV